MRIERALVLLAAVAVLLVAPSPAAAQEVTAQGVGFRVGVSAKPDQVFGGFMIDFGELTENLFFRPNLEVGFGDDETAITLNGALHYVFGMKWGVWNPYAGGELGVNYRKFDDDAPGDDSSDTGLGVNLIGGMQTPRGGGGNYLFELKLGLAEKPDAKFLFGITF
ncbi:MAG: hypothetical protein KBD01_11545 [Acidobacteria bacterium]|nr:hypothetical protein [Acidobacteriota bacterium]